MTSMLTIKLGVLILLTAVGYAVATYLMRTAAHSGNLTVTVLIAAALGIAVVAEIMLLQRMELGIAYLAILGAETVLVLVTAQLLGEGLTMREAMGGVFIIAGTLIVSA